MKSTLLIALLTLSVSCGKNSAVDCLNGCSGSDGVSQLPQQSVLTSSPSNDARLAGVQIKLDLSQLNSEIGVQDLIGNQYCNESLGNQNTNSVSPDSVLVSSSDGGRSGSIKFGHLSYYNSAGNDAVCRLFSNELYTFTFDGRKLELTQVAPGKAWDGSKSVFIK